MGRDVAFIGDIGKMNKVGLVTLFAVLTHGIGYGRTPGDTLSKPYLDAINHWLFGRDKAAYSTLRSVAVQGATADERESAKQLLLEEYYFWPGHYQHFISLADSLGYNSPTYALANLLVKQPPQQVNLASDSLRIPFALKHKAHIVVTVLLNGHPVRLALDSGAQRTTIAKQTGRKTGIRLLGELALKNYYGQLVPATLALADSMKLNSLTVRNLPVVSAGMPIPGIDGLLGWDILRQFAIDIDYVNHWLTIRRSVPDSTLAANLLGGSQPMLLLRSPMGNQLNFVLDTGSNETLRVSPTGLTRIGPYTTGRKISFGGGVGRLLQIEWQTHIRTLSMRVDEQPQRFKRIGLFKQDQQVGMIISDGLIGGRAFKNGRLLLDFPNHHFRYSE